MPARQSRLQLPSTGNATAIGRIALAVMVLYFSTSENHPHERLLENHLFWAGLYLLATIGFALVSWRSWWWDYRLRTWSFGVDIAMVMVLEHYEPFHYGFFSAALAIVAFVLFSTTLRFGRGDTMRAAIAINVVGLIVCIGRNIPPFQDLVVTTGEIDAWMDVRHVLLTAVITALALWMAQQINPIPRLPRFEISRDGEDRLEGVLRYAARVTGAQRGTLCWRGIEDGTFTLIGLREDGTISAKPLVRNCGPVAGRDTAPLVFKERRCLTLDEAGNIAVARVGGDIGAIISDTGYGSGLSLPLTCGTGAGWLILADYPPYGWDILRAAPSVASEISHGIDRDELDRTARAAAMAGMRNAIARDLHDSVAQSLAGAGYWLQSLQMRPGIPEAVRDDLKRTKQALDHENASIREMIDRLRGDVDIDEPRDLADDLAGLVEVLGKQWRLDIAVHLPTERLRATPRAAHEIQQIVREALANAVRHGSAESVAIDVTKQNGKVRLAFEDDGTGFADEATIVRPRSISERTRTLGGTLEFGRGSKGARVQIDLPVELFR